MKRKLMIFGLAIFLVNFAWMFLPMFDPSKLTASGQSDDSVYCPDGYAWRIDEGTFKGRLLECEKFTAFYQLIAKKDYDGASQLLVTDQSK